jgi:uncharacterized protein (TIGR02147 family)
MAKHIHCSPVIVTQVFKGSRDLSLDQSHDLTVFIGLNETESKYFMLLVQIARAGTHRYKQALELELAQVRSSALEIKNRVRVDKVLNEAERAKFYSHWYYSAIRLITSIPDRRDSLTISQKLGLPVEKVRTILEFLVEVGLVKLNAENEFEMGPASTHLESQSPFVNRHHSNWRLQALTKMELFDSDDLFYTGPMTLSHDDLVKIRKMAIDLVSDVRKIAVASKSEQLACLSLDLFKI